MPILGIGYLVTMVGPDPSNPWAHNIFQVIRCVLLSTQVTYSYLMPDVWWHPHTWYLMSGDILIHDTWCQVTSSYLIPDVMTVMWSLDPGQTFPPGADMRHKHNNPLFSLLRTTSAFSEKFRVISDSGIKDECQQVCGMSDYPNALRRGACAWLG